MEINELVSRVLDKDLTLSQRIIAAKELTSLGVSASGALPRGGISESASCRLPSAEKEAAIIELLNSPNQEDDLDWQYSLIRVLAQWGGASSAIALISILKSIDEGENHVHTSPDPTLIADACLIALKTIGGKPAKEYFENAKRSAKEEDRRSLISWCLEELKNRGTIDPTEGITVCSTEADLSEDTKRDPRSDDIFSPFREASFSMLSAIYDLARLAWNASLLQIEFKAETDPARYHTKYVHYLTLHVSEWNNYFSEWRNSGTLVATAFRISTKASIYELSQRRNSLLACMFSFYNSQPPASLISKIDALTDLSTELAIPQGGLALSEAKVKELFRKVAATLSPVDHEANAILGRWVARIRSANSGMGLQNNYDSRIMASPESRSHKRQNIRQAIITLDRNLDLFADWIRNNTIPHTDWAEIQRRLELLCQETLDVAQLFARVMFPDRDDFSEAINAFKKFRALLAECQSTVNRSQLPLDVCEYGIHVEQREERLALRQTKDEEMYALNPDAAEALSAETKSYFVSGLLDG